MELKVWVEGVVRVVCGLSLNTSCQDVVIALAQAIGQTGRYVLILKLRGNERHLVAEDCPLQQLAQLGQQDAEVQFILRRTGPSLSEGPNTPSTVRRLPLPRSSEPEPLKHHKEPQKAFTFNLGPSTYPKRPKPNRGWSPSPRASPEPRASPVSFLDPPNSILQQQRRLQDLDIQLQALERETEQWERSSAAAPSPTPGLAEELEELELQLRQNKAELMHAEHWEAQIQEEMEQEQGKSIYILSYKIRELQSRSAHLEQDLQLTAQRQNSRAGTPQPDDALRPLKQELHNRLQLGEELDATLSETQRELQTAEERVKKHARHKLSLRTLKPAGEDERKGYPLLSTIVHPEETHKVRVIIIFYPL
uniref:Ras association domain family member 7b n=1 Tax=Amphiprion percula TaxID=161767 RepID=A0A3P8RL87_AMPPE